MDICMFSSSLSVCASRVGHWVHNAGDSQIYIFNLGLCPHIQIHICSHLLKFYLVVYKVSQTFHARKQTPDFQPNLSLLPYFFCVTVNGNYISSGCLD